MTRENIEIVRRSIDAWNRGDWDAALEDAAPGFEMDMSRAVGPDGGVYGAEETQRLWGEVAGNWESVRIEADEFIEAGEHVAVPWTMHARGRAGIEVVARPTWVWTIRDGAVSRICMYQDREEALEAVGVTP